MEPSEYTSIAVSVQEDPDTIEDVVEGLNNDNAVSRSTNYLFNTPFYPSGTPQFRESLAVIAAEVYPRVRRVPDALRVRSEAPGADRA